MNKLIWRRKMEQGTNGQYRVKEYIGETTCDARHIPDWEMIATGLNAEQALELVKQATGVIEIGNQPKDN